MDSVAKLKSLKRLRINHTKVSGKGLLRLSSMHFLEYVGAPDGTLIGDKVAARKLHIAEKQKARAAGISVPPDILSPFSEAEDMLNSQNALKNAPRNGIELKKWHGKW